MEFFLPELTLVSGKSLGKRWATSAPHCLAVTTDLRAHGLYSRTKNQPVRKTGQQLLGFPVVFFNSSWVFLNRHANNALLFSL